MDRDRILDLLAAVADGTLDPAAAADDLASLPFAEAAPGQSGAPEARIDHHRAIRCGFPEVVFCQGKTPDQVRSIAREILAHGDVLLATRATAAHYQAVARVEADARFFEDARVIVADKRAERPSTGCVVVATGGTADTPVAEEAAICAEVMGLGVERVYDVGVAGLHRLLAHRETLERADVVIAVAGMEGALPSLVAGLVSVPVVAVPTSVGYGAHFGGVAPLLTMLNSCAAGIGVMNIDNGFGAASLAERIVRGGRRGRTMSQLVAHLDCSTGLSGDKFLGAVLDAGAHLAALDRPGFTADDLAALMARLAPEATLVAGRCSSHGISAVCVRLEGPDEPSSRTLAELVERIEKATLPDAVRAQSIAVFERLAHAEAGVHGTEPDKVHFHEIGGLDSLLDIVGAVAGLDALGIEMITATPVATGSGVVETSHGTLPVPAPATAALLLDVPTVPGPAPLGGFGELTTPTGAALVTTLASGFGVAPPMTPRSIGYGAGSRDIGVPNVARLIVGEVPVSPWAHTHDERIVLLETNLDHITPEQAAYALEELRAEGALDAWITPIMMKKNRPAMLLSLLTLSDFADDAAARMMTLTGTLGVRRNTIERAITDREIIEVETPWGHACAKVGAGRVRPEHDDVARIARDFSLPYGFVRDEIERLAEESID